MALEVLLPTTPAEAAEAFGDGAGVTIVGGGTIVVPELAHGRLRPSRVLMLARSGLDGITRGKGTVTIGAGCTIAELEAGDEPLATAAAHIADPEIRGQATVGGNLCSAASADAPRGDLQAPLIALDARVRSTGAGGERTEPIEEFLAGGVGRLVLDVGYDDIPRATGYAAVSRPHAHHYTILAACATKTNGTIRVAVTGAGPTGLRCPSVELAAAQGASASEAAERALADVQSLRDDALASAWYRGRVLPTLVARALADLDKETR
jgi:CO/xanthine dehydrogenase FAD-binding subunit